MKTAYDFKHVKGTTAIALLKGGSLEGKIVANWSDNYNGSVCTATVHILHGKHSCSGTGRDGTVGYDKLSGAIYSALKNQSFYTWNHDTKDLDETFLDLSKVFKVEPGAGNQRPIFESLGYTYVEVC